jgi:catechol 2,3-dioxygenase-like lactoylglutathione lyase family enzyme
VSATITDVGTVAVEVRDQDRALEFFTATLGFEARMDVPTPDGGRWVTVAPSGAAVAVALLARPDDAARDTGIRFVATDVARQHATMAERGVDVDDVLAWPGVPPMFSFRDPDGNTYYVVEAGP